jgi:large subunit ribosomal protein L24e
LVRIFDCSFCGYKIDPGTGFMYVKLDGTILRFCTQKCKKNMLVLKRKPQKLKWTKKYIKVHSQ